ncbi:hypothetical protein K9M74_02860 [Candidatus Woesearchaeota archaeon]|nr:hypothetical protein [Candidatus Woesearchaeota archaeon]
MTPKEPEKRTPELQAKFLEEELILLIQEFKKSSDCKLFLIFGNDDFKANEDILEQHNGRLWEYVNERVVPFDNFSIFGYTTVPITPFKFKDWEKVDSHDVLEETYRNPFVLNGVQSTKNGLVSTAISLENRTDSIENDIITKVNDANNLILVTHAPPYNTQLDIDKRNVHVGSIGVRNAIEKL